MLENGFSRYSVKKVLSRGDCVGTVEVAGGEASRVAVLADEDFSFSLAEGESVKLILTGPGFAYAPVAQGQDAGYVYICVGDSIAGKIPCVYAQTVEQAQVEKKNFWERWFGGGKQ